MWVYKNQWTNSFNSSTASISGGNLYIAYPIRKRIFQNA